MSLRLSRSLQAEPSSSADAADDVPEENSPAPNNIRVVVRVRPLLDREDGDPIDGLEQRGVQQIAWHGHDGKGQNMERLFHFDRILADCDQQGVFAETGVADLMDQAINGINVAVIAYGQTASGKTYTMDGINYIAEEAGGIRGEAPEVKVSFAPVYDEHRGLLPRSLDRLFDSIGREVQMFGEGRPQHKRRVTVEASFVQIYMERIYDLLRPAAKSGGPGLRLRWNPKHGGHFYVEGVRRVTVETAQEAFALYLKGVRERNIASHNLNAASSRSHSVFTLHLQSEELQFDENGEEKMLRRFSSEVVLVDLAGSERQAETGTEGARLTESIGINKSLFVLRKVINALSASFLTGERENTLVQNAVDLRVPYRESKLTSILKNALGGNAKTLIVACCSPSNNDARENLNTLSFAAKAQAVKNVPKVNLDYRSNLISKLSTTVKDLKDQLDQANMKIASLTGGATGPEDEESKAQSPTAAASKGASTSKKKKKTLKRRRPKDAKQLQQVREMKKEVIEATKLLKEMMLSLTASASSPLGMGTMGTMPLNTFPANQEEHTLKSDARHSLQLLPPLNREPSLDLEEALGLNRSASMELLELQNEIDDLDSPSPPRHDDDIYDDDLQFKRAAGIERLPDVHAVKPRRQRRKGRKSGVKQSSSLPAQFSLPAVGKPRNRTSSLRGNPSKFKQKRAGPGPRKKQPVSPKASLPAQSWDSDTKVDPSYPGYPRGPQHSMAYPGGGLGYEWKSTSSIGDMRHSMDVAGPGLLPRHSLDAIPRQHSLDAIPRQHSLDGIPRQRSLGVMPTMSVSGAPKIGLFSADTLSSLLRAPKKPVPVDYGHQ